MTRSFTMTRRAALSGAAALPLAAAATGPARAQGEAENPNIPPYRRVSLGDMTVTTLLAGTATRDDPHSIFGLNVSDETFREVSEAAYLPTDRAQFFFTPTVVQSGQETVLFDTGLNAAGTLAALEAAGLAAGDITTVVITHMHGDHIGGLMQDGSPTFGDARHLTGETEFQAWQGSDNQAYQTNVAPIADRFERIADGAEIAPGVTAMAAFGHTPGHMAYMLDSGDRQLLLGADFANHYVWSVAHPDWEVSFDMDKEQAAQTRRRILDMLASERMPFIGYHMPFPAIGYVDTHEDGFHYMPHSYQLML